MHFKAKTKVSLAHFSQDLNIFKYVFSVLYMGVFYKLSHRTINVINVLKNSSTK